MLTTRPALVEVVSLTTRVNVGSHHRLVVAHILINARLEMERTISEVEAIEKDFKVSIPVTIKLS